MGVAQFNEDGKVHNFEKVLLETYIFINSKNVPDETHELQKQKRGECFVPLKTIIFDGIGT